MKGDVVQVLQLSSDAFRRGDYVEARRLAVEAADLCRVLGEPWSEAYAVHLQGRTFHETGELDAARALYDAALRLSRESRYESGIAAATYEKARIDADRREFARAEEGFRQALKFYAAKRDLANLEAAIGSLSGLALNALDSIDEFVPAVERDGPPVGTAEAYLWVRAHAIMAELGREGSFYRRRLIQRAMVWHNAAPSVSEYALQEVRRTAAFGDDQFADKVAEILLSRGSEERLTAAIPTPVVSAPRAPLPFQTPEAAAPDISRLLAFLDGDASPAWVYRGQTKEYVAPLLPSAFRAVIGANGSCHDDTSELFQHSLRKVGTKFYGEYNERFRARLSGAFETIPGPEREEAARVYEELLRGKVAHHHDLQLQQGQSPTWDEAAREVLSQSELGLFERYKAAWQPLIDSYHRRCVRHAFFRLFGYFLGTTVAQQYGLASEGLDVTGDPTVAAFFATHDSATDYRAIEKSGTGIVYRIPYPGTDVRARKVNDYGYYTLPSVIDVEDVLYRFERPGLDMESAIHCFECFCGAVLLEGLADVDQFFVPEGALASSRIRRQRAFIILPDELREDVEGRGPGPGGIVFPKYRYIEDLAARRDVQKFYFRHGGLLPEAARLTREDLWPRDDRLLAMIVALMTAVYPLGAFIPEIMPGRLELIDAGYEPSEFLGLCKQLSARHHMVMYDYQASRAANLGAIPMKRL